MIYHVENNNIYVAHSEKNGGRLKHLSES